ncbi:MAG: 4-(cytidine 5'-diphospho)-2-C-methyl-D-erythritol kinase [Christensenella sp.]
MRVKAYAKLNLALDILETRSDGMHELDMLMQSISLADVLVITHADKLEVRADHMAVRGDNTVKRAAELFFRTTGICGGARIWMEKQIPAQAGLGGGSSDAAATLWALNDLYGAGLGIQELRDLGVRIGADVPFFFDGGCMRARGIGEKLEKVKNTCDFFYLLVKPNEGVPTSAAYARYDERPKTTKIYIDAAARSLEAGACQAYFASAGNALQGVGIQICPPIAEIMQKFQERGADFTMMTGSGSCVFAVFAQEEMREYAYRKFAQEYPFCQKAENVCCGVEIAQL